MQNKRILSLSIIIILVLSLTACQLPFINVVRGSGSFVSKSYAVSAFDAVQLDGAGKLIIIQGEEESLEIEAEDNLIDQLTVEVENGTLAIGFKEKPWHTTIIPTHLITYTLTIKDLRQITINGASDVALAALQTDSLAVTINGAAQVRINDLLADSLSIKLIGAGNIVISGQALTQNIEIDGAGNVQADDLMTDSTVVEIDGLGNASVWAGKELDIVINGGGSVSYFGSPTVSQEINGLGDVNPRGEK